MLFEDHVYKYMYSALQLANKAFDEEEIPIGAVIVYNNKIIGKGYNQVEKLKDPTAHAELIAITAASSYLGSKVLKDCDIYVTVEPCLMCTGAIVLSKIRNLYIGTSEPKFGACGSMYNIPDENKLNSKLNVYSGIMEKEASELMKLFFKSKR